jgi:cytidine deaminase
LQQAKVRMNTIEIKTEVKVYGRLSELPPDEQRLVKAAGEAVKKAYAPYSEFYVGAAILSGEGTVSTGSNMENASFPIGLCAERIALANKFANHPAETIRAIAVSVENNKADSPASPCGMCRQALLEAEVRQKSPIRILLKGPSDEVYVIDSVKQLLPLPFSSKNL